MRCPSARRARRPHPAPKSAASSARRPDQPPATIRTAASSGNHLSRPHGGGTGEEELIDADEALAVADGAVSTAPDDHVTVTVWTAADHPQNAAKAANNYLAKADVATRLGSPPLIGVEVVQGDEYVRRGEKSTLPELIGATEAAGISKVTRQRVNQLAAQHGSFPAPVLRIRMGSLWTAEAVRAAPGPGPAPSAGHDSSSPRSRAHDRRCDGRRSTADKSEVVQVLDPDSARMLVEDAASAQGARS